MTNVWNGNVNGSPWQLLRADQNDSSFIQKEIYRLSPQHFSSMFPLSSNAHCGPETRWGQKTKHQEPFCYPSQLPSPEQMMASGVYQTGNTHKPRWLFFVMFQIRRGDHNKTSDACIVSQEQTVSELPSGCPEGVCQTRPLESLHKAWSHQHCSAVTHIH